MYNLISWCRSIKNFLNVFMNLSGTNIWLYFNNAFIICPSISTYLLSHLKTFFFFERKRTSSHPVGWFQKYPQRLVSQNLERRTQSTPPLWVAGIQHLKVLQLLVRVCISRRPELGAEFEPMDFKVRCGCLQLYLSCWAKRPPRTALRVMTARYSSAHPCHQLPHLPSSVGC